MLTEFNLANLERLDDGRIVVAFDQAQQRILTDLADRPALDSWRDLVVKFSYKPVADESGELADVTFVAEIKEKIPARQTRAYSGQLRNVRRENQTQRQLIFNDMSDDNIHQRTIDEV